MPITCRDRHCPKCLGGAAREWLAARQADLLPVPYFHVLFSLPKRIANIAYHNKAVIYGILFKAAAEICSPSRPILSTSAPASASPPYCTVGVPRSRTTRICI